MVRVVCRCQRSGDRVRQPWAICTLRSLPSGICSRYLLRVRIRVGEGEDEGEGEGEGEG